MARAATSPTLSWGRSSPACPVLLFSCFPHTLLPPPKAAVLVHCSYSSPFTVLRLSVGIGPFSCAASMLYSTSVRLFSRQLKVLSYRRWLLTHAKWEQIYKVAAGKQCTAETMTLKWNKMIFHKMNVLPLLMTLDDWQKLHDNNTINTKDDFLTQSPRPIQ